MEKLQTFDLSYFNSKRFFGNDRSQNYLIFPPNFKNLIMHTSDNETIIAWISKTYQLKTLSLLLYNVVKFVVEKKHQILKETFTRRNTVNLLIVYELDAWSRYLSRTFSLSDCLFGAVKLTNNTDPYKCGHSSYSIGFDALLQFSLSVSEFGNIVVICGVENSLSVHADNREKEILVLGEEPMDGLDDTSLKPKAKYIFNATKSRNKINSSLHYNAVNSFLCTNCMKIQALIAFTKHF